MSDNPKETEKEMEKAIFISADCWLEVFDLLPPSQLGLGIALISHRFDYYVYEHFKTRRWALVNEIRIIGEIGKNGAKEMKIVNANSESLPIPQIPLPNKIIGFRSILIYYIDQNVLTFLRRFHRFFPTCATMLNIITENVRISEFAVLTIWPLFKDTTILINLTTIAFHRMRQLVPAIFNDCPCLEIIFFHLDILPEFPLDDSANASDGQAVAKWLFTPHAHNLSKQFFVRIDNSAMEQQWSATEEQIKTAFLNASSPVNFVICVFFPPSSSLSSVVPFELTNEFTGEKLTLSQENGNVFKLIRSQIVPKKIQQKIVKLADRWNRINISTGGIDEGLLNAASTGPSDDQKQQKMN